jgi:hypothetical protein
MEKTRLFFGSFAEPEYAGAGSKAVAPELAHHWHVVVGGTQCSLDQKNIGKHMPDFLRYAYEAGVSDEKKRLAQLLGVST